MRPVRPSTCRSPPRARSVARAAAAGVDARPHRRDEKRDDARLVVSELVGNAVRHARPLADGTMQVAWGQADDAVDIAVTDGGALTTPERDRRRSLRPRRPRPGHRRDPRLPLVGGEHPLPHHRARAARPGLTRRSAALAAPVATLGFGAWERSRASATVADAGHRRRPPARRRVGPRQPCPCGSGRRYKACHGSAAGAPPAFVARPFEGLPGETDLVALREFVPAATAPLPLRRTATAGAALLPAARRRPRPGPRGRRRLARAPGPARVRRPEPRPRRGADAALDAEPGSLVGLTEAPGDGPRLQDLVADEPLDVTVHSGFDYWVADLDDPDGSMAAALEQANEAAAPTERLTASEAAYWTSVGNREYLRWVLPDDEDRVLDGFARLHAAAARPGRRRPADRDVPRARPGRAGLGPAGRHRRRGPRGARGPASRGTCARRWPIRRPLTSEERSARAGLASRQLTIR